MAAGSISFTSRSPELTSSPWLMAQLPPTYYHAGQGLSDGGREGGQCRGSAGLMKCKPSWKKKGFSGPETSTTSGPVSAADPRKEVNPQVSQRVSALRDMDGDVDIDLPEVSPHILLWRVGFSDCPQSFLHSQCHSEL